MEKVRKTDQMRILAESSNSPMRNPQRTALQTACNQAVTQPSDNAAAPDTLLPLLPCLSGKSPARTEYKMDLLLWRHAEAEEGPIDIARRLTPRGEKQAEQMAQWLHQHQPKKLRIIASPALRTQQTVKALKLPFETIHTIGPDANVADLIAASGWPTEQGAVLIVGHQPTLGRLAALLLSGQEADWTIKKGALWWFSNRVRQGETQTILRAMMTADLCD